MIAIVYETSEGVEESENVLAYDETTDYWVIAPQGEGSDMRRRIPGHRVYSVETDEPSRIGTW